MPRSRLAEEVEKIAAVEGVPTFQACELPETANQANRWEVES